MSDLAVIAYKGEDTADQVLNKVTEMQKEYLVDLEDAGVLIRDKKGKVRIKQSLPLRGRTMASTTISSSRSARSSSPTPRRCSSWCARSTWTASCRSSSPSAAR